MLDYHQEASDRFIVFASHRPRNAVKAWAMANIEGLMKECEGSYKGATENSYLVNAKYYPALADSGLIAHEESLLLLEPCDRKGHRPAVLWYLNGEMPEYLGTFQPVPRIEALTRDAWTLDKSTGQFYICR